MHLSKISHRHELRIRVDFPYNAETTAKLKQITDTRWSQSLKCWHVPYTKEVFEQLKELFPEVEYTSPPTPLLEERGEIPPATEQNNENDNKVVLIKKSASKAPLYIKIKHEEVETKTLEKTSENKSAITVTVYSKIIEIKMPKDEADIQFIRSFKFAKWNTNHFCWTVPN